MRSVNILIVLVTSIFLLVGCQAQSSDTAGETANTEAANTAPTEALAGTIVGKVLETMDSGGYTYVLIDDGSQQIWAAGPQTAMAVGNEVTVETKMPMPGFKSETLGRSFDLLYFVSGFGGNASSSPQMPEGHPSIEPAAQVDTSGMAAAEYTVEKIFSDQANLGGTKVQIRAKVVKFNAGIMGRNWLHIQDGTGGDGTNDLTVTTSAICAVGDQVLIEGMVALNKDFGAGYAYDVIVEEAAVTVE